MPKYAQLHDGTTLEFPDETQDSVIDATVKKHLGIEEKPGMLKQIGSSALQSLGGAESLIRMPWNVLGGSAAKGIRTGAEMLAGNPLDYSLARGDESAQAASINPVIKSSAGVDEMLGKAYEGARSTAGEIASSGPGWNPNMKGGDAELLLKNEAANRSLGEMGLDTMAFKGVENLRSLGMKAPPSPYAAAKKAMGVERMTDAEFIDFLEQKKKGNQAPPEQPIGAAGPLQGELPLGERNDPMAAARDAAQGELRTLAEQAEFLRREQTGTKDMFQDTGLEREPTGLEPKRTPPPDEPPGGGTGGADPKILEQRAQNYYDAANRELTENGWTKRAEELFAKADEIYKSIPSKMRAVEPEGITKPGEVNAGFEATRVPSKEGTPLDVVDPAHTPSTIPYSNTIFDYVYSRFPELTEIIAKDKVAQRLMAQVEEAKQRMLDLKTQAGTDLTKGIAVKEGSVELMPGVKTPGPMELRNTKAAQARMDALKAQHDATVARLDQLTGQLSNRLKSRAKALGIDIADNAKFSDWVNDRQGSTGPVEGSIYTKGQYKEGAASANIKKSQGGVIDPDLLTFGVSSLIERLGSRKTWEKFKGTFAPDVMRFAKELRSIMGEEPKPAKYVKWTEKPSAELGKFIEDGDMVGALNFIAERSPNLYYRQLARLLNRLQEMPTLRKGDYPTLIQTKDGWVYNSYGIIPENLKNASAHYSPKGHEIVIKNQREMESILLHETIHAAVSGSIWKYKGLRPSDIEKLGTSQERETARAVVALDTLFEDMKWRAAREGKATDYMFTNLDEFLAEGLTSPDAIRWLRDQDLSGQHYVGQVFNRMKDGYEAFVTIIKHILNIPEKSNTALEGVLRNVSTIIEKQRWEDIAPNLDNAPLAAKDKFQEFKDSLPKPYQHMAESLWKDAKKEPVEPMITNEKQLVVGDTLKSITGIDNNYVPLIKPFKEVRDYLMGGEDVNGTKLGQMLVSGGKMYAQQTKSRVIKYATDIINASKKAQEVATYNKLFAKDGIISMWEKLSKNEQGQLWDYVKQHKFKEWRTTEQMLADGLSQKQVDAYLSGKKHLEQTINDINAERVAHGEKEITPMPGYFPSRWKGNFYFEVMKRHGDGRLELVRIETGNWKGIRGRGGLEGTRQKFLEEHGMVYEVGEIQERPRFGDVKQTYSLFDNLLDTIGRDHPDRAILDSIFEQYEAASADKARNFRRHFDINTGVEGYRGDTLGKSSHENAVDALYSLEGYMRDAHNYIETKRASREVNAMLYDKELTDKNPNAMKYVRKYWDNSNGVEPQLAKLIDYLPEQMASAMGFTRYAPKMAVQAMKRNMMIFFLGFNRPVFLLSQAVQPIQFMTPYLLRMKTEMGIKGYDTMVGTSQTKGYFDAMMSMTNKEGMTPLGKEALKYATDNRIVDPHFLDEIYNSGEKTKNDLTKLITGQTALQMTEKYARLMSFLSFTHLLEKTGMKGETLHRAAADATDIAMTNYVTHERALIYKQFGIIGDLASPLTTFKHNYFSQLYMYGKEALKHPTDLNYSKPLLAFLMTQYVVGGFMGLPGRQELDFIIDTARAHGLVNPMTRNVTQFMMEKSAKMQHGKDAVRYGIFSAATGVDVSPTFSAANLIPERGLGQLFPVVGKVAEIAGNTANVGGKEIGRLFGGQGSTSVDRAQLIKSVTPPGFKVWGEMANQNPKTGMIPNPNDHMTGDVRRGPPSLTDKNWQASALGTNSIPESEQRSAAYQSKLQEDAIRQAKQKLIGKAKDLQTSGKPWTKEAQEYMKLGGSMNEMVNAIKENQMDQNQTREERAKGIPKNIGQINRYERMQRYGVSK